MKYLVAFLVLVTLGVRYWMALPNYKVGERLRITGVVSTEPIVYENNQRVSIEGFNAYVDLYPRIYYGDRLVMEGMVGEKQKLLDPKIVNQSIGGNWIYTLRRSIVSFYQRSLPPRHAALVSGMVLGSREGMSQVFWEQLVDAGVVHVVVASGTNVVLVGGFFVNVLIIFVSRKKAVVLAMLCIWFYTLFSGFDAPLVRAAIMGTIVFTAQVLGRLSSAIRALIISVFIMLLIKPMWIRDVGFVMSFAATASLMLFESKISRLIFRVPKIIRNDLSTTLAAQIGVLPILMFVFGRVSFVAPITNTLILWTVVPIMIVGGLAGLLSMVYEPLAAFVLLFAYPLTNWFVFIVNMFS